MGSVRLVKSLIATVTVLLAQAVPKLFRWEYELGLAGGLASLATVVATLAFAFVKPPNPRVLYVRSGWRGHVVLIAFAVCAVGYAAVWYYQRTGPVPAPWALWFAVFAYAVIAVVISGALTYFACLYLARRRDD